MRRDSSRWVVLAAVIAGAITYGTVNTILAASLADIADDLDTSKATLSWAITGPFLALGVGNPIFGRLGDRRGRRLLFVGGLTMFSIGTFVASLSQHALTLIGARALSGLGASMAMPNGTAMVLARFAPEERARALGWQNFVGTTAPAIGLLIGGPMIDAWGWRNVFAFYGFFSLIGLVGGVIFVHDVTRDLVRRIPIDVAGAIALAFTTIATMLGLTFLTERGIKSTATIVTLACAPVGIVALVAASRRAADPIVPVKYFRRASFTAPLASYFMGHLAYMGSFVIAPVLLYDVFDFTVATATYLLVLRPLTFGVLSPAGVALNTRIGVRSTAIFGSGLMLVAMAVFLIGIHYENLPLVVVGLAATGSSFGIVTPPYAASVVNSVDDDDLGVAQGIFSTSAGLGTVVGIQLVLLLLGDADPYVAADFIGPFVLGIGGAAAMLALSLFIARRPLPLARAPVRTGVS